MFSGQATIVNMNYNLTDVWFPDLAQSLPQKKKFSYLIIKYQPIEL